MKRIHSTGIFKQLSELIFKNNFCTSSMFIRVDYHIRIQQYLKRKRLNCELFYFFREAEKSSFLGGPATKGVGGKDQAIKKK